MKDDKTHVSFLLKRGHFQFESKKSIFQIFIHENKLCRHENMQEHAKAFQTKTHMLYSIIFKQ